METQFVDWSNRLAKLGYTVLLPSSYSARGFCDLHDDTGRIPSTFDEKPEQILSRLYDVDAAARYLCNRTEVDCERMGLLGFSQGATMVMVALHWQIDHAIKYFRDNKASAVDFPVVDVKPGRPEFEMGVAYYPGCGFDGIVPLSTSLGAAIENKFSATAPLTILHGSADSLVTQCSTQYGTGARQIHAKQVADSLKISDLYEITVYEGAHHSFDSASSTGADATARDAALKVTLAKLASQL
jgi:dienelactone hydrolase